MIAPSASQYLHPEQQAAIAHADSSASPLALLVQTCSAIGKDSSSKQLIPTLGKIAADHDEGRRSGGGGASAWASASAGAANAGGRASAARSSPPDRASSAEPPLSRESASPVYRPRETGERRKSLSPADEYVPRAASAHRKPTARDLKSSRAAAAAGESTMPAGMLSLAGSAAGGAAGFSYSSLYHHWLPYFSQLCAAESAQQQARSHAEKAAYSALTHPALRAPPCRDVGCVASHLSHTTHLMPSAAAAAEHYAPGCPCCLDKLRGLAGAAPALPPLLPHLNAAAAAAAFLAAVRPQLAPSGPMQVCHWVSGSDYCGKQFATVDDLLQHVKTHAVRDAVGSPSGVSLPHQSPTTVALPLASSFGRAVVAAPSMPPPPAAVATSLPPAAVATSRASYSHSARLHPYAKQYHSGQQVSGGDQMKPPPVLPVDLSSSLSYLSSPYAALFGPGGIGSAASR